MLGRGPRSQSGAVITRDPRDLRRLLWSVLVLLAGLVLALWGQATTGGAETDLIGALGHLPQQVVSVVLLAVQLLHLLLFLGIPLVLLVTRRWRRWLIYTFGYALAAGLVLLLDAYLVPEPNTQLTDARTNLDAWPTSTAVASGVVAVTLLSPHLNRAWIRFGWAFVSSLAILRVLTSQDVVLDVALAFGVGGIVGNGLLLAFGRRVVLPTPESVTDGLAGLGLVVARLAPRDPDASGATDYHAELADGSQVFCRIMTAGQHEAQRLLRNYRRATTRGIGEDASYSTVRREAAVEAMLAMSAARAGARTPEVLGVTSLHSDDAVAIAYREIGGRNWDEVPADEVTDDMLDQAWRSVAALRSARIAHRDLEPHNWLVDDGGSLWLTDFAWGDAAAEDGALNLDVAELLAATYAMVGAERAVAAAVRGIGVPAVSDGIGYLVPAALSRATRGAVKGGTDGLEPLIEAASTACGVPEPTLVPIERVKPRTLLMGALLVLAVYVLLPQFAQLPRMLQAIQDADVFDAGAAGLASLLTYIGTGLALVMAMPVSVALWKGLAAALAATFAGAIAPPGVAHVGVNIRFAQRQGLPNPAAVSAMAAKETSIFVVHVVLLLGVAFLAGTSGVLQDELDKLPSGRTLGWVAAVVIALVGLAFAVRPFRRALREKVVPALRHSVGTLRELARSPMKLLGMFAGSLIFQLGYIFALYFSVQALGGNVGIVTIALIYLTVGSVASVAPTPGGVGAVEAVLLGALTGVGMAAAPALAAVFLYRLVTFWIPIPIGAAVMRWMIARDLL